MLLAALACSSRVNTTVDFADQPGVSIVMFAVLSEDGSVTRVTEPLGLEDGAQIFGERPEIELGPGEASVVLVTVSEDALRDGYPGYDDVRRESIVADVETPASPPVRSVGSDLADAFLEGPLPSATTVTDVALDGASSGPAQPRPADDPLYEVVRQSVAMRVPVDIEYCRGDSLGPLRPFAAGPMALDDTSTNSRFVEIIRLDDDTLVALNSIALHVVRRGQQTAAADAFEPADAFPPSVTFPQFEDVAVQAGTLPDGSRRLFLIGSDEHSPQGGDGYLFVLRWDGNTIELVRTATVVDGGAEGKSVATDETGRFVANFDRSRVFFGDGDGTNVVEQPVPPSPGPLDEARHVVYTGDPAYPWLLATRGRLHLWDDSIGRWETTQLMTLVQESLHFTGLGTDFADDGTPVRWASGSRGPFFRFDGETWGSIEPELPPVIGACVRNGTREYPLRGMHPIESLAVHRDRAYTLFEGCPLLLEIRDHDQCVSTHPFEGLVAPPGEDLFEVVRVLGDELVVAGRDSRIYSAPLR